MAVGVFIDDAIAASIARYVAHRDDAAAHERARARPGPRRPLPAQGRVPRDPRPRAAQPARADPQLARRSCASWSTPAIPRSPTRSTCSTARASSSAASSTISSTSRASAAASSSCASRVSTCGARVDQALQMVDALSEGPRPPHAACRCPRAPLYIDADFARITQIVVQSAQQRREIHRRRRLHLRSPLHAEAGQAVISVRDNGIGIAPEMLESVFELFARVGRVAALRPRGPRHRSRARAAPGAPARRHDQREQRRPRARAREFEVRLPLPLDAGGGTPSEEPTLLVIEKVRQDRRSKSDGTMPGYEAEERLCAMPLVTLTSPAGLYCEAGDFHIDPWRPVERAVITHAHSDHASCGTRALPRLAAGRARHAQAPAAKSSIQTVDYGEALDMNGVRVSLHPAGHVLGSAQVRLEHGGEVWVVVRRLQAAARSDVRAVRAGRAATPSSPNRLSACRSIAGASRANSSPTSTRWWRGNQAVGSRERGLRLRARQGAAAAREHRRVDRPDLHARRGRRR